MLQRQEKHIGELYVVVFIQWENYEFWQEVLVRKKVIFVSDLS